MNLTDDEIRIKVAEAMGWLKVNPTTVPDRVWPCLEYITGVDGGMMFPPVANGKSTMVAIQPPNYPQDLNACAEFEATLSMDFNKPDQWEKYMDQLHCLVYPTPEEEPEVYARKYVAKCRMISAKARQRCIAYLKTKGLIP